jgi:hypothetical protein
MAALGSKRFTPRSTHRTQQPGMPMTRTRTALLAAAALLLSASARAQGHDGEMRLSLGYDGRLLVKVLDMQVDERATTAGHSSSARLVSYGLLAAFKHIDERASSSGRIVRGDPRPGDFSYANFAGKTKRRAETVWSDTDVTMHATPPFPNLGDVLPTHAQKMAAADPLTQLMRMALNGQRADLCRQTYHFFDGKQLYDLAFSSPRTALGGQREQRLGLVNLLRCDVRYIEVAGFKKKPAKKANGGIDKPIVVEFAQVGSTAGPWVLSSLHAQTPLGQATIELDRVTLTGKPPV